MSPSQVGHKNSPVSVVAISSLYSTIIIIISTNVPVLCDLASLGLPETLCLFISFLSNKKLKFQSLSEGSSCVSL